MNAKKRSDDLMSEIFNFKVLHGRHGIYKLVSINYQEVPFVSPDIKVVMITNFRYQNPFNQLYLSNPDKINLEFIHLNTTAFRCGIDLIEPLYDYVKNINEKYVLYLDASDTAIVSDLLNPQEILDAYNCKILFNAEDGYGFPDHPCVNKKYIDIFNDAHIGEKVWYYDTMGPYNHKNIVDLQNKSNCAPYMKSLNSGAFLADREYLVEILSEMLGYMYADSSKGYPYGEIENQKLWQYLQATRKNNEIEIDYFNLYFIWCHDRKFDFPPESWEHYDFFYRNFYKI